MLLTTSCLLLLFMACLQEDEKLRELVAKHGAQNWSAIAKALPGRNGKSCRLRWVNQLRDDIKTESFSEEEDRILLEAHRMYGNRWTQIAKLLPGRSVLVRTAAVWGAYSSSVGWVLRRLCSG
jgi:hypothetical protein